MSENIFNLTVLKSDLEAEDWTKIDDDHEERSVYLGTVMNLFPSGKFYMPWSSNVSDDEAEADEDWREKAEAELESLNAFLTHGEGDPCDLYATQSRDDHE